MATGQSFGITPIQNIVCMPCGAIALVCVGLPCRLCRACLIMISKEQRDETAFRDSDTRYS